MHCNSTTEGVGAKMVVVSWDMGKLSLGYCKTCLVIVCTGIIIDPFETPVIGIGIV